MKQLFVIFIALMFFAEVTDGLVCYRCTDCDSPTGRQVCDNWFGIAEACLTIETLSGKINRQCGTSFFLTGCEIEDGVETCYCDHDLCNSEERGEPPEPEVKCYDCKNCKFPQNLRTCKDSFGKPNKCLTETTSSGIINRGCYAGDQTGCRTFNSGEFCYCSDDACNNKRSEVVNRGNSGASPIQLNILISMLLGAISTKYLL